MQSSSTLPPSVGDDRRWKALVLRCGCSLEDMAERGYVAHHVGNHPHALIHPIVYDSSVPIRILNGVYRSTRLYRRHPFLFRKHEQSWLNVVILEIRQVLNGSKHKLKPTLRCSNIWKLAFLAKTTMGNDIRWQFFHGTALRSIRTARYPNRRIQRLDIQSMIQILSQAIVN